MAMTLWALAFALACAQTPDRQAGQSAETPGLDSTPLREAILIGPVPAEPLMWTVQGGLGAKLTLLGSIHFGPPAGWTYPKALLEAFGEAGVLVVEADDTNLSPEQQQALVARYAFIDPSESIEDLISAETYARLRTHLETSRLDFETMQRLRPWMISTILVMDAFGELGFSPLTGVDRTFLSMAGDREVLSLESVEFQMKLMADLSNSVQELALIDTLDEVDEAAVMMVDLADAWRKGDEPLLTELLYDAMTEPEEFAPLAEAVLHARNRTMAQKLYQLASDANHSAERIFVVIGAAHFVGEGSIVDRLADRGLSVERFDGPGQKQAADLTHGH